MKTIFAADIGGTNSRFACFNLEQSDNPASGLRLVKDCWLKTRKEGSLGEQLSELYQAGFPLSPEDSDIAVFAVAGPVSEARYSFLPLVGWRVDLLEIQKLFPFPRLCLINDFKAHALAVLTRPGNTAQRIIEGERGEGPIAVIGAGTGLGKALLLNANQAHKPLVIASEGGHADFPFFGEAERRYQLFLAREKNCDRISGNTVVSGSGLSALHQFLYDECLPPSEVGRRFDSHPLTLEWAARFYGRVCRNFVLETLANGGIYISGGLAAKLPMLLSHRSFKEELYLSEKMSGLLRGLSVMLMDDENSGLWGSAMMGALEL